MTWYWGPIARVVACIVVDVLIPVVAIAEEFPLPTNSRDGVIGEVRYTRVISGDTLLDIARALDVGHDQIIRANPTLNRWVPTVGAEVVIPSMYVLPSPRRTGIVLNLAELRLYYYQPRGETVHTFPVSIGDYDWRTPQGTTSIIGKEVDPSWYPPASIRQEHREEGEELPHMIPGGDPSNPLGHFALKLGITSYLIHGTDARRSYGIGMRVSHGCIRMYPEDIETLYAMVKVGTSVRIIDEPVKAGWLGDSLFLEVHQPLLDEGEIPTLRVPTFMDVERVLQPHTGPTTDIDQELVDLALRLGNGIPIKIGHRIEQIE